MGVEFAWIGHLTDALQGVRCLSSVQGLAMESGEERQMAQLTQMKAEWRVPTWLFVPVSLVFFTATIMGTKLVTNMLGGFPASSGIMSAVYLGLGIGAVITGLGVYRRTG
jgi:hypothetical protein